jgi:hypothetical protein
VTFDHLAGENLELEGTRVIGSPGVTDRNSES